MKLQPRLRVTAQDFDYTKEKLDLKLAIDVKRRDKKQERQRLMAGLSSQQQPQLMFLNARGNVRDSINSQNILQDDRGVRVS